MKQKEDFFVQATLIAGNYEIINIPCRIYLPERVTEKPRMEFRATKKQWDSLAYIQEVSFKAEILQFNYDKDTYIEAPTVYLREKSTRYWGPDFSESTFSGAPQHLCLTRFLSKGECLSTTSLNLWISPNNMLSPTIIEETSFLGKVGVERISTLDFEIQNGITLTFDRHFRSKVVGDDERLQWSFLVASADVNLPTLDVVSLRENLLSDVDDFLLIASLGSRTRTACLGWEAADSDSITTYYRGNFNFPTGRREPGFSEGLVSMADFQAFIDVCYPQFLEHPNKNAIRDAIHSVVPDRKKTLEASFLAMFTGIETILLDFRRREDLEFTLSKEKWSQLCSYLMKCIKHCDSPVLEKNERAFLYGKLKDLNRAPLGIVFERFCNKYAVDLTDLWPVFSSAKTVGLSDIRNRIIHGEPLPLKVVDAVCVAEKNLRFTLERILVSVLGWPIEKTEVDASLLRSYSKAIQTVTENQEIMSKNFWP